MEPFRIPFDFAFAQRYLRCCSESLPFRGQRRARQGSQGGDELEASAFAVIDEVCEALSIVSLLSAT